MASAIDRPQSILQSTLIDRIQQVQQQHPDAQQKYFEIQLGQERRNMMKKVNESEELSHSKVIEEETEKQQKERQKKREAAEQDLNEESSEPERPGHIDIKV
jgi:hypothetical protein